MKVTESQQMSGLPQVSVIVLNYNGARWLQRCLRSLRDQTLFGQMEVIVADNASPDGSDELARSLMVGWGNGQLLQNGENLGYCEGNNRAAQHARGRYLFFLNNDTWLEPDCLEVMLRGVRDRQAQAAAPRVLNYDDDSPQYSGGGGFDVFGLASSARLRPGSNESFIAAGCAYLIDREFFSAVGGFDAAFYMYSDEYDLSWRVWTAGGCILYVPEARLHHRGAASVNPAGGERVVEYRTSDTKRFYANRNSMLVLLKNCQHVLLPLVALQWALSLLEACVLLLILRRWSFVRRAYLAAWIDCWRLRHHVVLERKRISAFRRRGDLYMLRFMCLRLARWDELANVWRMGLPRVDAK